MATILERIVEDYNNINIFELLHFILTVLIFLVLLIYLIKKACCCFC